MPARLLDIPLKSFMFPSDFVAWRKLMIKRKTIEQKMGSCDAAIARMVLLCQVTAFVIAGLLTLAVAFAAHGQYGKASMTCTNSASGVSWQINIDYNQRTVDANPAQISDAKIWWHDAKDGGNYTLDRKSGDLTVIVASSTGGYFIYDRCRLQD